MDFSNGLKHSASLTKLQCREWENYVSHECCIEVVLKAVKNCFQDFPCHNKYFTFNINQSAVYRHISTIKSI
jgi:hypothetical protein